MSVALFGCVPESGLREGKKNPSPSCRDRYSGEKVPTLQEAVEECIRHQLTIFFDVKDEPDKVGKKKNILTPDAIVKFADLPCLPSE